MKIGLLAWLSVLVMFAGQVALAQSQPISAGFECATAVPLKLKAKKQAKTKETNIDIGASVKVLQIEGNWAKVKTPKGNGYLEIWLIEKSCPVTGSRSADPAKNAAVPGKEKPKEIQPATSEKATPPEDKGPAKPKTVLVVETQGTGLNQESLKTINGAIAQAISTVGNLSVTTSADIDAMLQHEVDKQRLGCATDSTCLARLTNLTQSDLVLLSSIGQVGQSFVVNVTLVDSATSTATGKASSVAQKADQIPKIAADLTRNLFSHQGSAVHFQLPSGQTTSFAVFDLAATGVSPEVSRNLTNVLSASIKSVGGTSVVSSQDIQAMLQLSETKIKLGCLDDTTCLAEIGGALGVEKLVVGSVGKLGDSFVLSLNLIDARKVSVDNRFTETLAGPEDQLIGLVRYAGRQLLGVSSREAGQLVVSASENGAEVFLDDKPQGQLPRAPLLNVPAGPHQVRINKPGFFLWQSDVFVDPGNAIPVWAELRARPAKWPFWTAFAATAAAGLAGGTCGLLSDYYENQARELYKSKTRPADRSRFENNARSLTSSANILFIGTAGLALTTGLVALFTDWEDQ